MKILAKFLSGLLVVALSSAIMVICLDATILKASFITAKADQTTIYNSISSQLIDGIASNNGVEQPMVKTELSSVITPGYVKSKLAAYLQGLENHYRLGGAAPQLDLSDLPGQLSAAGVTLPADAQTKLNDQINQQLGQSSKAPPLAGIYHTSASAKLGLWLAAIVLAILLVLISPGNRRLRALAKAFFGTALLLGVYYVILRYLPSFAAGRIAMTGGNNPLLGSVNQLLAAATAGVASVVLRWIIGLVALGAVLLVAEPIIGRRSRKPDAKSDQARKPLPILRRERD